MTTELSFMHTVLSLFEGDNSDNLWWRVDDTGKLRFFALCNDLFWWGTADAQEILPQNLSALIAAFVATKGIPDGTAWAGELFACRLAGKRPQGAKYQYIPRKLWPLFDACGPVRDVGMGNPYPHPLEGKS